MRQAIFDFAIHGVGRALLARDVACGWARINWRIDPSASGVSRHTIKSGRNMLDAVLVRPPLSEERACVLICHGIGETVQRWHRVQQLLAASGVVSLVFDYSGYGRSTGIFGARQAERDAVAAFHFFESQIGPLPISLLGFSLGSGVATAILARVPAKTLLLCAAFTSIREAAHSIGIPKWLGFGVPPIWRAADVLRESQIPVLIVHGDKDRLFPVSMAQQLNACCGSPSRVIVVPRLRHNEPFHKPSEAYWRSIVEYLHSTAESAQKS